MISNRTSVIASTIITEKFSFECDKAAEIAQGGAKETIQEWEGMAIAMRAASTALREKIQREFPGPMSTKELKSAVGIPVWYVSENSKTKMEVVVSSVRESVVKIKDTEGMWIDDISIFEIKDNNAHKFYLYEPSVSWGHDLQSKEPENNKKSRRENFTVI